MNSEPSRKHLGVSENVSFLLKPAAEAYERNMEEVSDLFRTPAWISEAIAISAETYTESVYRLTGKPSLSGEMRDNKELLSEVTDLHLHLLKEHPEAQSLHVCPPFGFKLIYLSQQFPNLPLGFKSLCVSMLLRSYVSYEALKNDMLRALRKHGHKKLEPHLKQRFAQGFALHMEKLRNNLAHHGSVIDDKFYEYAKSVPEFNSLIKLGPGNELNLIGSEVSDFVDDLTLQGCALISEIDGLLKTASAS